MMSIRLLHLAVGQIEREMEKITETAPEARTRRKALSEEIDLAYNMLRGIND